MQTGLVTRLLVWLCGRLGVEVVQAGWRQIPAGHINIDPALVAALDTQAGLGMAVVYSVIDRWNRSNERANKRDHLRDGRWWSWGWPKYWTSRSVPWMAGRTWERNIERLAAAGLVQVDTVNGQPAFSTLRYSQNGVGQFVNEHGQFVNGVRQTVEGVRQTVGNTIEDNQLKTFNLYKPTSAYSRGRVRPGAVVAEFPQLDLEQMAQGEIPETADAASWAAMDADSTAEDPPVRRATLFGPRPPTPGFAAPPPDDDEGTWQTTALGDGSSTVDDGAGSTAWDDVTREGEDTRELAAFFSGAAVDEVQRLVARHGAARIRRLIEQVRGMDGVRNPPGMVLTWLRNDAREGVTFPADGQHRYVSGKYADFVNW